MTKTIDALVEALEAAREYVDSASRRMYDGTNGHGIRQFAEQNLVKIDAALAQAHAEQAEPVAGVLTDSELCDLQCALHTLTAIAERKVQCCELIEPVNDIRDASKRAKYALGRFEPLALRLLNQVTTPPAAPVVKTCDMGQMCLGCEPKRLDGGCPDAAPVAKLEPDHFADASKMVPLTDAEIQRAIHHISTYTGDYETAVARALEAALNAKRAALKPYHLPDTGKMVAAEPTPARQHITDGTPCWCEPELSHKDPDTGADVWVHRGIQ